MIKYEDLSKRERQVLDMLYKKRKATATEIQESLAEHLSNSTVRTILRSLEKKGFVKHGEKNLRYVFEPKLPRNQVRKGVIEHFLAIFCDGSPEKAMAAIIDASDRPLSPESQQQLESLIRKVQRAEEQQ